MKNIVIHFGGGALGRGLVIPLLYESHKAVVLVDTNKELIKKLSLAKSYSLDISDDPIERIHQIKLHDVLSSIEDKERLLCYLREATIVTTSVRRENLKYVAPVIAEAWRTQPRGDRCVICCENVEGVGSYFQELLIKEATSDEEIENLRKIRIPDTIVDRICAAGVDIMNITSERFHECSVDQAILPDTGIDMITSTENLQGHFYRKRYLLNAYADSISFLAKARGLHYLYEAASDPEINQLAAPYMKLLVRLLKLNYQIEEKEALQWMEIYRSRLSNSEIPRELSTVARSLWTKLTITERFIQPLIQLMEKGEDIREGLDFVMLLIQSELDSNGEEMRSDELLKKLKELWGITSSGNVLLETFYETIQGKRE